MLNGKNRREKTMKKGSMRARDRLISRNPHCDSAHCDRPWRNNNEYKTVLTFKNIAV